MRATNASELATPAHDMTTASGQLRSGRDTGDSVIAFVLESIEEAKRL